MKSLLRTARLEHYSLSDNGTWQQLDDAITDVAFARGAEELARAEAEVWRIFDAGPPFPWDEPAPIE